MFLRVSPRRGHRRFGKNSKLSPRFIGPFEVLDRVGQVAYQLPLLPQLSWVHDVFHVLQLRKYHPDSSHVLDWSNIEMDDSLIVIEAPIQILDRREKLLRGKAISLVRVLWQHRDVEEET